MTTTELKEIIESLKVHHSELNDLEVKSARGGTPRRLFEVLSAFSNRPGGGVLLLGLDEEADFEVVGVGDAQRIQEEVSHLASADMEPALRPVISVHVLGGKTVVAVEVPEVPIEQKPCYYKSAGLPGGAFIRVGNTNRRMTDYEVFGFMSARGQPTFDEEVVAEATLDDLDMLKLEGYVRSLQRQRPKANHLQGELYEVLKRLRVVKESAGVLRPTLAGLLVFGKYPQMFEPQLVITFLQYYGVTETEKTPRGERFLDNQKFEGALPELIESAVDYVMASMRKSSLVEGLYRRDIPEYPQEAIREVIVNAVAHRDYSHYVRGSQVQIRMFADRLEVQSPGGLFGNVTEERLEDAESTRNRYIMRFLEDLHIAENRGSGIETMIETMRKANLEPPRFYDRRDFFRVVFRNHSLMNPEAVSWLNRFSSIPLSDRQRTALVYLRQNEYLVNSDYQRLTFVDSVTATRELRHLVQMRLVQQFGTRGGAFYKLAVSDTQVHIDNQLEQTASDEEKLLDFIRTRTFVANSDVQAHLGVDARRAGYLLKKLVGQGYLKQQGSGRWTKYITL